MSGSESNFLSCIKFEPEVFKCCMFLFAFADTADMNLWSQTLMEAIIMTKVKMM